ncbi:MAG: DUF308 domain-containing protein [Methanogenium sp.]|nr:DUF308 domain-containing protein [Methanogenium sp.]
MDNEEILLESMVFTPKWWTFLLQGLFAIIFGSIALLWAPLIVTFIALFIGILIILYSATILIQGITGETGKTSSIILLILGVLGVLIGIYAISNLWAMWITLAYIIALWAFMSGFGDLWLALTHSEYSWYRILLAISGIIGIIVGFYIMIFPALGDIVIIQVVGIFAIASGLISIITGILMKGKLPEEVE